MEVSEMNPLDYRHVCRSGMPRSGLSRNWFGAAVAALLLLGCFPGMEKSDHIEVGTIVRKIIYGYNSAGAQRLMEADQHGARYISDSVKAVIESAEGKTVITERVGDHLHRSYATVDYRVRIRLCLRRTTEEYIVTREIFNKLRPGIIAKFVLNGDETVIDSLIAY